MTSPATPAANRRSGLLAIELVDELVDGAKSAALPLIRTDLHLSYAQIGLLLSVPIIAGNLVEAPMGILADRGWRRRLILSGGAGFALAMAVIAGAHWYWMLLAGFVLFYPTAPTRRSNEGRLGKVPTTSQRRPTSRLSRSNGLVDQICRRCSSGKL